MKLHPSMPLALALAAGMAGAALAQTPASPYGGGPTSPQTTAPNSEASWNSQHPQSSYAQPQANYGQPQSGSAQPQAAYNPAQMQPNYSQGANPQRTANGQTQSAGQPQNSGNQQVSQAQAQLQAAGLYNGPQDGVMDPDTRAAIARFQSQHNLRRTESLDPQTMAALMNNQTTGSGSSASGMAPAAPNAEQGQPAAPMGAGGNTAGQTR